MLKTERLVLRKFVPTDCEALYTLLGNKDVMESSVNGPLDSDQTRTWLEEKIAQYKHDNGVEVLALVNKSTSELIGYCGLFRFLDVNGVQEIEVGYRLVRHSWGKGYATEAAKAIRDYAFSVLKLTRLIALIEPTNERSIRVAEKLGMEYENDVMLEGYDHPDHLYSMSNEKQ